jgi:LacI family transcriptional regulator
MNPKKGITIHEVARLAGVSPSTVSVVLSKNAKTVSAELQQRVNEAAERLNYRPNLVARSLKVQSTKSIGFVFPNVASPIMAPLVHFVENTSFRKGYDISISVTEEDPTKERIAVNNLLAKRMDGLIICPIRRDNFDLIRYAASQIPLVLIDRSLEGLDGVVTNNKEVSYRAVCHLLAHGRRRVGLIAMKSYGSNTDGRIEGYQQALKESGLFHPELMQETDYLGGGASESARDLLVNRNVDAVFATSQSIALMTMLEARKLSLRIPQDLGLFAFDDVPWMDFVDPSVSTTRQPVQQMAEKACEILFAKIQGKHDDPENVVIESEIILRKSCGC